MINKNHLRKFIKICKKKTRDEVINLSDDITRSFSASRLSQKYNLLRDDVKNAIHVQKFINLCYFYDEYHAQFIFKCLQGGNPIFHALLHMAKKDAVPLAKKMEPVIEKIVKDPEVQELAMSAMGNEHVFSAISSLVKGKPMDSKTVGLAFDHVASLTADKKFSDKDTHATMQAFNNLHAAHKKNTSNVGEHHDHISSLIDNDKFTDHNVDDKDAIVHKLNEMHDTQKKSAVIHEKTNNNSK
jgi:hypothetical protein